MFFNNYRCRNIGPVELERMVQSSADIILLDVRTTEEHEQQKIEDSYHIPVQELGRRFSELPRDKEIVVYCRIGNRSAYACAFLAEKGYRVKNLEGGILLWNMAGHAALSKV